MFIVHLCQEIKLERHNQCQQAAETFMRGCARLQTMMPVEKLISDIMTWKKDTIQSKTGAQNVPQASDAGHMWPSESPGFHQAKPNYLFIALCWSSRKSSTRQDWNLAWFA